MHNKGQISCQIFLMVSEERRAGLLLQAVTRMKWRQKLLRK
jgi:hypothetical protein